MDFYMLDFEAFAQLTAEHMSSDAHRKEALPVFLGTEWSLNVP
jgi:hypothetical protein